tara:strand:- start:155 stop:1306 length:1152 start_codon:yes stop_codon:yes gene_type:complete
MGGSLQSSRYDNQQIVNSFNIFVDSEKAKVVGDGTSKGDDVKIHFEGQTIEAGAGEIIRLSLLNFTMFNNLYMIDANNSKFNITYDVGAGIVSTKPELELPNKNYKNYFDIADAFADLVGAFIVTNTPATAYTKTTVLPNATALNASSDRLLDITLTMTGTSGLTDFNIQCKASSGDTYTILGGNRLDSDSETSFSSLKVSIAGAVIRIQGYYPMQRMSDPYVYIRCGNIQNGLEMSVLSSDRGRYNSDIINSDILGKVFRDVEFISYESNTGIEYFMNLQQKKLSQLRLFLTDSKGRFLGRVNGDRSSGSAAGLVSDTDGKTQSSLGNLFFTAVLRVDIIRVSIPQILDTTPIPPALPASKAQKPAVIWPQGGLPKDFKYNF